MCAPVGVCMHPTHVHVLACTFGNEREGMDGRVWCVHPLQSGEPIPAIWWDRLVRLWVEQLLTSRVVFSLTCLATVTDNSADKSRWEVSSKPHNLICRASPFACFVCKILLCMYVFICVWVWVWLASMHFYFNSFCILFQWTVSSEAFKVSM